MHLPSLHERWLQRALGQATAYVALVVAVVELLRRERVVTATALSGRTLAGLAVCWVLLVVWRAMRERAA